MDTNKLGLWSFALIEDGKLVENEMGLYTGINECFGIEFETTFKTWMNDMLYIFWELQKRDTYYYYIDEKFVISVNDEERYIEARAV